MLLSNTHEGEEVLPLAGLLSPLSRMASRTTKRRTASQTRANKKHANNVARVLKGKLTKLVKKQEKRKTRKLAQKDRKRREKEVNNAMRFYENQEGLYNAPENHYNENIRAITSMMPSIVISPPIRSKEPNSNFFNSLEKKLGMKSRKHSGRHTANELFELMQMNIKSAKKRGHHE